MDVQTLVVLGTGLSGVNNRMAVRQLSDLALAAFGLEALAQRPIAALSGGEQQRVAIARAMINSPELILADEPTGNLDARHGREALALIREVCREEGAALLLVSHDEGVLARFETVRDFRTLNRAAAAANSPA